jgi:hypothetical protein
MGVQFHSIAQTSINSGGGNSSGGGSVSYTIGQITYSNNSSLSGSMSEGIQQPYEISIMTGIEDQSILLTWSVYPNPVVNDLTLRVDYYDSEKYSYKIFDIKGNLLAYKRISGDETTISMATMIPGTYLLQVCDIIKVLKTFRIIKNK